MSALFTAGLPGQLTKVKAESAETIAIDFNAKLINLKSWEKHKTDDGR